MIGKKTKEGAGDINTQDKFIKTYKLLDLEKEYKFVLIMGYSFQMEKEMKTWTQLTLGTLKTLNKMLFYWNQRVDSCLVELYQGHSL